MLLQYAKENNLEVQDIYIDDGYSGTNFDRPEFRRLLYDIENKKINMVITKDLSRLGRDYIKTGEFLEKYFPEHKVRYISVTDNIDTFLDNSNNDIAPFKAIMNDFYAKDISKKIRSSLKAKMKEGKFVGCRPPFGYMKDKDNKNQLVINKEQAYIVKKIFQLAEKGNTPYKIAEELTKEKIRTPSSYYNFKWKNNYQHNTWHPKTIKDILTNQMYIGDLVQNKRNKVNYKVKKIIRNNPYDFIIVPNTHEAIIDKDLFYKVQKRIPKDKGRKEKKEIHLLDGLLYCGDCNHHISVTPRRKSDNKCYTICNYYRTYIKDKLCTTHSNNYDELEKSIINLLIENYWPLINEKRIKDKIINSFKEDKEIKENQELNFLINDINQIKDNLDIIYIDKLNKKITEEQFLRIKSKLEEELIVKEKRYKELNSHIKNNITKEVQNKIIIKYVDDFLTMKKLNRELVINLIDKIEIFADKTINIKVSFKKCN